MLVIPESEDDGLRDPYDDVDEDYVPLANAIASSVDMLIGMSLVAAGRGDALFMRMERPRLGDLVVMHELSRPAIHRVGIYLSTWTYCPWEDDYEENAVPRWIPFEDRIHEEVYYIRTLDGRGMKWTNVQVLSVPDIDIEWADVHPIRSFLVRVR